MTQRYILDENVVIYAQRGENEQGEPDSTCMSLIEQIIDICHTLVIDPNLWDKYNHQLSLQRHAHPQAGFRLIPVIAHAVRMAGTVDIRHNNAAPFSEESTIPRGSQDDVELVRLAVETGDTLVTTDKPLREHLNDCGVLETYELTLLSPKEALEKL